MSESLEKIRSHLAVLPQGRIGDVAKMELLLAACWNELSGNEQGGMLAYKLIRRTENMEWNPPFLTFEIERHGATVHESVFAELQPWTVDIFSGRAEVSPHGPKRLVGKRQLAVDVKPLAEEIVALILAGKRDERLDWSSDARVKVLIGKILPEGSAVRKTLARRRKRLGNAIAARLEQENWQKVGVNTFVKY
jgi:hypothetical protein